jgi:hypothetical protein
MSYQNYFLTKDLGYISTPLQINDRHLEKLIKMYSHMLDRSPEYIVLDNAIYHHIKDQIPFKQDSYQYVAILTILISVSNLMDIQNLDDESSTFWSLFLRILKSKNMELSVEYISQHTLKPLFRDSLNLVFEHDLVQPSNDVTDINQSCFLLEHALYNQHLWKLRHLLTSLHSKNKQINDFYNDKFKIILHVTKELYKLFNVPYIKEKKHKDFRKSYIQLNAISGAFPLHYIHDNIVGTEGNRGFFGRQGLIEDVENYEVRYARGYLHHLGDSLGWILGAMTVRRQIVLGHPATKHFCYKISNTLDYSGYPSLTESTFRLGYHQYSWTLIPKKRFQFVLDKGCEGENSFIPYENKPSEGKFSNVIVHSYANNPVFQKYAQRNIDNYTTSEFIDVLYELAGKAHRVVYGHDSDMVVEGNVCNTELKPIFIKTIVGKLVIDVISNDMSKTTYAVKENNKGITFIDIADFYRNLNHSEISYAKVALYRDIISKTINGSYLDTVQYLDYLQQSKHPQWIISDIIDMHDEYRIFIVNHKVVVGTPCHRRSTPLDMYPIGRFHPGLSFSHKSKFIRINPKTRKRVADYIRFARKFAKEMKIYGEQHKDYHIAIHGNYVLDVAWSKSRNCVIPIEINEGGINNPGNTGMYATNTIKLMSAYMGVKYLSIQTSYFARYLTFFAFKKGSLTKQSKRDFQQIQGRGENYYPEQYYSCLLTYEFEKNVDNYLSDKNHVPLILKDRIKTGKQKDGKDIYLLNHYLDSTNSVSESVENLATKRIENQEYDNNYPCEIAEDAENLEHDSFLDESFSHVFDESPEGFLSSHYSEQNVSKSKVKKCRTRPQNHLTRKIPIFDKIETSEPIENIYLDLHSEDDDSEVFLNPTFNE